MKYQFLTHILIFTFTFLAYAQEEKSLKKHKRILKLMGSRFEITAVSENGNQANAAIDSAIEEIKRLERLISSWDANSQTSAINKNAGIKPVKVDRELYDLIYRSKKISKLTNGVFDISFASIDKIWKFDGSMKQIPSRIETDNSIKLINYQNIILNSDSTTVFLKDKNMKIGFGAIGKGYAANKAKQLMQTMGIENGVVNASGDLISWGNQTDGQEWSIAITDPKDKTKTIGWLNISNQAVVTSGNYEKFVEFDGIRYSHIINPKTGMPATGTKSVTVICPDAELADALATSVFILGEKEGIDLINKLKGIECFLITDKDELKTSQNLKLNYY
jgi:FAD:protein FMN transferase